MNYNTNDTVCLECLKNGFSLTTQYTKVFPLFFFLLLSVFKICSFLSFVRSYLCDDYFSVCRKQFSWLMMPDFVCQAHSEPRAAKNTNDFSSIQLSMYIICQFSVSKKKK